MKIATNHQVKQDLAVNWHPFMQMKDFEEYPPKRIIRAEGLKLFSKIHGITTPFQVGGAHF